MINYIYAPNYVILATPWHYLLFLKLFLIFIEYIQNQQKFTYNTLKNNLKANYWMKSIITDLICIKKQLNI